MNVIAQNNKHSVPCKAFHNHLMMSRGVIILDGEFVIFVCDIHVHFASENISSQANVHVGESRIDSVEDGLSVGQRIYACVVRFGGFVTDNKLVRDADFSVALLVVDWVSHEVVLTFNALFK